MRECSLSAVKKIVCHQFLVLMRDREALLQIMLPISVWVM